MLFTEAEFQEQRKNHGLVMTEEVNRGTPGYEGGIVYDLTMHQFEHWLETRKWSMEIKNRHRKEFKGKVLIVDELILY